MRRSLDCPDAVGTAVQLCPTYEQRIRIQPAPPFTPTIAPTRGKLNCSAFEAYGPLTGFTGSMPPAMGAFQGQLYFS